MSTASPASTEMLQATIDCFWETMPPVWHQIREHLREIVTENFDITVEQFHILRNIRRGMGSVSELAAAKHISRPAISQGVELLVHKGLIARRQSSADRRYVQLALTESGSALLNAIFDKNRGWMLDKLAGLSATEVRSLQGGLEALKRAFDESAERRPQAG